MALILVLSLASCGSDGGEETSSGAQAQSGQAQTSDKPQPADTAGKKILTVYFSSANTADVDAVSSATPSFGGTGSTGYIAEYIHGKVGGDIAKIIPVKDYPESYNGTLDAAKAERDNDKRPEFKPLDVNPEDYDVIFVGYPMWWYTLPMIMYTFFDTYDFSGKTVIPFNTHAGSGDGGTYREIKGFEPDAIIPDGLAVSGSGADKAGGDIDSWLSGLGF
ncbi:MAG: NAD(P)H-dependent oxidoreductase [Clostridia bacterium]|nr:NAD(P)H-dependent oxidoreductase [Clostridia bacterium]